MKKMLSSLVLFFMVAVSACSTTPSNDSPMSLQEVLKSLEGTWESTGVEFVFSGNNLRLGTDNLTLAANPNSSIILGNKTYAVYMGNIAANPSFAIFRAEGDEFFGDHDDSLEALRAKYNTTPSIFTQATGTRKKS